MGGGYTGWSGILFKCLTHWPFRSLTYSRPKVYDSLIRHVSMDLFLCCLVTSCSVMPRSLITSLISNVADFRVQTTGTGDCLSAPPTSEAGSPVILSSCDGEVSQWVFTLTGSLMVRLVYNKSIDHDSILTFDLERRIYRLRFSTDDLKHRPNSWFFPYERRRRKLFISSDLHSWHLGCFPFTKKFRKISMGNSGSFRLGRERSICHKSHSSTSPSPSLHQKTRCLGKLFCYFLDRTRLCSSLSRIGICGYKKSDICMFPSL